MQTKTPKLPRRSIETHLEADELRQIKVLAAELGSHTVTITTEILRAALLPVNRDYVLGLIKEAEARTQGHLPKAAAPAAEASSNPQR